MKIAVVGAGISGLAAAWELAGRHEVHVFEAAPRSDYFGDASTTGAAWAEEVRKLVEERTGRHPAGRRSESFGSPPWGDPCAKP